MECLLSWWNTILATDPHWEYLVMVFQQPYDFFRSIRVLGNCRWRFFSGTNFSGRSFEVSGWEVLTRASKWGWREGQVASAKVLKQ